MSIKTTQNILFSKTQTGTFVDITNLLAPQGLEVDTADLVSDNPVTTLDGKVHRGKYAERNSYTLTFRALTQTELNLAVDYLKQEYFYLKIVSPDTGEEIAREVYCEGRSVAHITQKKTTILWGGLAATLIERNATSI